MTFIAIAPNYWGKGATPEEAKKNLKAAGGNLSRYLVYLLPAGATNVTVHPVNGAIEWEWTEGADTSQGLTLVASRGVAGVKK
jgi:hypothetical protein